MDNSHRTEQVRWSQAQRYQAALCQVVFHHTLWHDAEPDAVGNGFLDHLKIIETEDCVHGHAAFAEITIDVLLNGKVFIESDECQILQLRSGDGAASRKWMLRRGGDYHLFFAPW